MAWPDKIGNRRGKDKWFSDAELERWTEAYCPVRVVVWPAQGLGVVEPQHHEAKEVHPDRTAPAAQRGPVDIGLGGLAGGATPHDLGVRVPREPRIIEDGALDGGEPHREEAEHQAAGEREAQLGARHGQTRADELVELGAARCRGGTLAVDDGTRRVAADQLPAPEGLREQV